MCPSGLEYLRSANAAPDERAAEAIQPVASKRDPVGRWPLETRYPGTMPLALDRSPIPVPGPLDN